MMVVKKNSFIIFGLSFLMGIFLSQSLRAANVLKIGSYTVQPNTECTVQVEAENSDAFVAFQVDIPIPSGFSYVDGSAQLTAARITDHVVSASLLTGNILRLIGYSAGNKAFTGSTGTLVSFKLKSGTVPAKYILELKNQLMSDNQSVNIPVTVINGDVTLQAPNIKLSATAIDYGRVPLMTTPSQSFQITNDGNKDLIISTLQFNDSQFITNETTPFTLSPGNSRSIAVKFTPTGKSTLAKQLTIGSNDPDQPSATIDLKAIAFAVNEIHTGTLSGASSSTVKLDFTVNNMEEFTGIQFDLSLPQQMTYVDGSALLSRLQDHSVSVSAVNSNTLRVLVFSPGNKSFTGTSGKILSLDFLLKGVGGYYSIGISNVILANATGDNILSASFAGSLQITAPSIQAPTTLNFGDVSTLSDGNKTLRINNNGQEPLIISDLMFPNDYFKSTQTFPLTIPKYGYFDLPLKFVKSTKGSSTGTLKIVSNDPVNSPFLVQVSGNAYVPNYLLIKDQTVIVGSTLNVPIEIQNEESFVAFQFDLKYPAGLTPNLDSLKLTDRKQDHSIIGSLLGNNLLRIVVYSGGQKAFTGKSGPVLTIPFKCETNAVVGNYTLDFTNALMSNVNSENILYQATNGNLKIKNVNSPPVANAGTAKSVNEGTLVTLDGTGSSDPDSDALTYLWTAPTGITLSSTTASKPTFTAPEVAANKDYTFSLVVNDGTVSSVASQVVITVKNVNKAPVYTSAKIFNVKEDEPFEFVLEGTDADSDPISFTIETIPTFFKLVQKTSTSVTFSGTIPNNHVGDNIYKLTLSDGITTTQENITIKVEDDPPFVKDSIKNVLAFKNAPSKIIDLNTVFGDDDTGHLLSFNVASNSNIQVVTTTINGSDLTLTFSSNLLGKSDVVINATSNGKIAQSKFTVDVSSAVGIDPGVNYQGVLIYPNPTSGKVRIQYEMIPRNGYYLKVKNINGKTVLYQYIQNKDEVIDLTGNPPGLYLFQTNLETLKIQKLIIK